MVFLLSIKPKYGYAILDGKKKFELRKCIGKPINTGDLVVMYFSTPVKAIMGYFIAGKVIIEEFVEIRGETVVEVYNELYPYYAKAILKAMQIIKSEGSN